MLLIHDSYIKILKKILILSNNRSESDYTHLFSQWFILSLLIIIFCVIVMWYRCVSYVIRVARKLLNKKELKLSKLAFRVVKYIITKIQQDSLFKFLYDKLNVIRKEPYPSHICAFCHTWACEKPALYIISKFLISFKNYCLNIYVLKCSS